MADRIGVCGDCGAKFKIPPTFQGTKAKCKKCGGTVAIPSAKAKMPAKPKAAKPAAAPKKPAPAKAEAGAKKKVAGKTVRKASFANRRAAGKGGARARGGRRKEEGEEKSNKMMWILVAAGVSIVAIVILVIAFSGDDAPPPVEETLVAEVEETAPEVETEPETVEEPEIKEEPETNPEPENVVAVPDDKENVNPIIEYELMPPLAGCSQERFDELTDAYTNGYLKEDLPAYKRRKFKKTWDQAKDESFDVIPVMLNAFNGLDLLTKDDVAMGFRVAQEWNEYTGIGYVDLNFKGDITDEAMKTNLYNNVRTITSLINLWQTKYATNATQQESFLSRVEVARVKAKERAAKRDDDE